jgi:maltose O-acetyltransferase
MRIFGLIFYYSFLQFLPASNNKYFKFIRVIRSSIGHLIFRSCGKNVNIERKANFGGGSHISIGDNSGIGYNSYIRGPLIIGNNVMMGPEVIILTSSHNFDSTDIPMNQQGHTAKRMVVIKDDVWIGTRVIIMPGISIGQGVIIGAGAIVTKNIPDYAIVGGNPAKIIRYRNEQR